MLISYCPRPRASSIYKREAILEQVTQALVAGKQGGDGKG